MLHLAEGAAYNRIEAARAARRFPAILERLAAGSVSLTTVRLLAPHLTCDNHRELLEAAHHKSKREIELIVAALHPKPPAATVIRKVHSRLVEGNRGAWAASPRVGKELAPEPVAAPIEGKEPASGPLRLGTLHRSAHGRRINLARRSAPSHRRITNSS